MTPCGTVSCVWLDYAKSWEIIVFTDRGSLEIGRFKDEQQANEVFDNLVNKYNARRMTSEEKDLLLTVLRLELLFADNDSVCIVNGKTYGRKELFDKLVKLVKEKISDE